MAKENNVMFWFKLKTKGETSVGDQKKNLYMYTLEPMQLSSHSQPSQIQQQKMCLSYFFTLAQFCEYV